MSSEHQFCDYNFGGQDDFGPTRSDAGPRQYVQIERSLLEGIRSFMNRRFDQDRLIKYQDHFIREIDRILTDPPEGLGISTESE